MYWLAPLLLFAWAIRAFNALPDRPDFSKIPNWHPSHPRLVLLALLIGVIGFYVRYHFPHPEEIDHWFYAFLIDLAPEMVGMAFAVVVIDELNQRRLEQQEKDRLFAQVKSPVRDMAVEALRLIREKDWFGEMLEKYNHRLTFVQWQGADLQRANLQRAKLWDVNLQEVKLERANLQEAKLLHANLKRANLWEANLKRANLWG